jgi:Transmembrane family 220, helix
MTRILTILDYLMAALFGLSVAVQYNDPDPGRWMLIYGSAAVACLLFIAGRRYWPLFATVGAAALTWACLLVTNSAGHVPFGELFEAFEMKDVRVEEAREMYGLLIVTAWMAVLTFRSCRRSTG